MSGLFSGVIEYNNNVKCDLEKIFLDVLNTYKIDKLRVLNDERIYMVCGMQYIKNTDKNDMMPYLDKKSNLIINGDIILDNREELLKSLEISKDKWNIISDSQLVLKAYLKWGYECPEHLLGDFAFVIFNKRNEEIFCVRDHTGCRPFNYYYKNGIFAFSTLCNSLIPFTNKKLNERWITDFLAIFGPVNNSEAIETIYEDIYQLPPAHAMIINKSSQTVKKYWDPLKEVKPLKLKSHSEYVKEFLRIFNEAIDCRIDTSYDVGIMVSGGLDSGSIAALASEKLKHKQKVLKGFTFVPLKDFAVKNKSQRMVDESSYVNLLKNHCGNMDVNLCRNEGITSISNIDELIDIYEQPIKTLENSYWITQIVKECSENNIRVLLSGQFGNGTISFGDFFIHMDTLVKRLKINEIINEVECASKKYSVSKKKIYKRIIKNLLPYDVMKIKHRKDNSIESRFLYSPVNTSLLKKWNVAERFDKKDYNLVVSKFCNLKSVRNKLLDEAALTHISIMETKDSLKYGIIQRDPTRDKRVIEFCLSIPSGEYVHKGEERYLIRSSMKGILPEEIRTNWKHRGIQSADWIERLIPSWKNVHKDIELALADWQIKEYIDVNKIKTYLKKNENISDSSNTGEIKCLLIVLVFYKFLIHYRSMLKNIR